MNPLSVLWVLRARCLFLSLHFLNVTGEKTTATSWGRAAGTERKGSGNKRSSWSSYDCSVNESCTHTHAHTQAHAHTHAHVCTRAHRHTHTHSHVCTHTGTRAHTLTRVHTRTRARTHTGTGTHTHTCAHARTQAHACVHTPMHVRTHPHIHTRVHTPTCTHPPVHVRRLAHKCPHTCARTPWHRGSPARRPALGEAPARRGPGPAPPARLHCFGSPCSQAGHRSPGSPALKEHRLPPAVGGPAGSHLQSRQRGPRACRG